MMNDNNTFITLSYACWVDARKAQAMVNSIVKNKIKAHQLVLKIDRWKDELVDPICDMISGMEFLEHMHVNINPWSNDCAVIGCTKLFEKLRDLIMNCNSTSNSKKNLTTNKSVGDHDNGVNLIINRLKKIEISFGIKANKNGINDLNDMMTTLFAFVKEMDEPVYVMAKVDLRGMKCDEKHLSDFKTLWDNIFSFVIEHRIPVNVVLDMNKPDDMDIYNVFIPTFKEKLSSTKFIQPRCNKYCTDLMESIATRTVVQITESWTKIEFRCYNCTK